MSKISLIYPHPLVIITYSYVLIIVLEHQGVTCSDAFLNTTFVSHLHTLCLITILANYNRKKFQELLELSTN